MDPLRLTLPLFVAAEIVALAWLVGLTLGLFVIGSLAFVAACCVAGG